MKQSGDLPLKDHEQASGLSITKVKEELDRFRKPTIKGFIKKVFVDPIVDSAEFLKNFYR